MLGVAAATTTLNADAYWAVVFDRGAIAGVGLRTDTKLIVSREGMIGAMATLARDAASPKLHDVLGPRHSVESFALAMGGTWERTMEQTIFECRSVVAPPVVAGVRRLARAEDRELVANWIHHFATESLGETMGAGEALTRADAHIAKGTMHAWDVAGDVASIAAAVAPTPHGVRINHVYTPPERRAHGYASALVASLTQAMLDAGRAFAFLHADAANPIANRLYLRLGYRKVGDLDVLRRDTTK